MPSIQLGAYSIRIKEKESQNLMPLNKFNGKDSIYTFLKSLLNVLADTYRVDKESKKILSLMKINLEGDLITGMIESGEYGYASKLYDTEEENITYDRKSSEAELFPMYFLFDTKTNGKKGIMIIEKFGQIGILTILKKILINEFKSTYPEYVFEINPLIPKGLLKYYLGDGNLKKLVFTTYKIPTDVNNVYEIKGYEEKIKDINIIISAKRNSFLPKPKWIRDIIDGKREISELIELHNDFKEVKIEVDIQGNTRTIALNNLERLNPYFDISDRVETEKGHPTYESINYEAIKLLEEIESEIFLVS